MHAFELVVIVREERVGGLRASRRQGDLCFWQLEMAAEDETGSGAADFTRCRPLPEQTT